jgi:pimeloyl-ACP methyl ester carboxylesterase
VSRFQRILVSSVILTALALVIAGVRGIAPAQAPVHVSFGRGSTVVLIHGLGSRSDHWLGTARILARDHRVVLVQLPGHGESRMPEPFSLERAVESLDRALGAESREPLILVGHSIGGLVAAAEALDHPDRVRALVLVETALRPQFEPADREAMLDQLEHHYRSLLRTAYLSFGRDSIQGAALYAQAADEDSASMKQWIRLALTADLSRRARDLQVPVLAVLSARTWPENERWSETARELGYTGITVIQGVRVADSGHFVMLDHPDAVAAAIEKFVHWLGTDQVATR